MNLSQDLAPESTRSDRLESEVGASLVRLLGERHRLHLPGVRDRHRHELEAAIGEARSLLATEMGETSGPGRAALLLLLARAYAARAEDARYGAGQLSRGAQRAPTEKDCEEGWARVREIVETAEASAGEARRIARDLREPRAEQAAWAARSSALAARHILTERNQAYTFHADPGFSFGEGWYLAAAGVLSGVAIQVEPDKKQTSQALQFLEDAGLGTKLVPYRPRPRANKALPAIVAEAFRLDPWLAQSKLRTAFLGFDPISDAVAQWTDGVLAVAPPKKKVLIWVRRGVHQPSRNSTRLELEELCARALQQDLVPILVGDAMGEGSLPRGAIDLTLFWKLPLFQGLRMRRAQLQFFECMKQSHRLVGQAGVTTAGMDGPALIGLPTAYLTQEPNVRLGRWVGAVPDYREIVRTERYLDEISELFGSWASR